VDHLSYFCVLGKHSGRLCTNWKGSGPTLFLGGPQTKSIGPLSDSSHQGGKLNVRTPKSRVLEKIVNINRMIGYGCNLTWISRTLPVLPSLTYFQTIVKLMCTVHCTTIPSCLPSRLAPEISKPELRCWSWIFRIRILTFSDQTDKCRCLWPWSFWKMHFFKPSGSKSFHKCWIQILFPVLDKMSTDPQSCC
jgi:hypothetical protein